NALGGPTANTAATTPKPNREPSWRRLPKKTIPASTVSKWPGSSDRFEDSGFSHEGDGARGERRRAECIFFNSSLVAKQKSSARNRPTGLVNSLVSCNTISRCHDVKWSLPVRRGHTEI